MMTMRLWPPPPEAAFGVLPAAAFAGPAATALAAPPGATFTATINAKANAATGRRRIVIWIP
jgi:hypothetical protein